MDNLISYITSTQFYIPLGLFVGTYAVIWAIKNIIAFRLRKISASTSTFLDDMFLDAVDHTKHFFMVGAALYVSFKSLHLEKYEELADKAFLVIAAIQIIIWGKYLINSWFEQTLKKKSEDDPAAKTSLGFLNLIVKFVFIVGIFLFVLNNLGVNISTFIAGLGVGGVAIALATQNILGDLFSSLSIVMDKPFVVGDFISLGDWLGTVEHVGLKTTRLRSLTGEQIVISNSDLLSSRVRNFKRMFERRVVFQLGVTYGTKRENLKIAPQLIEEIIRKEEHTRFDRAHFKGYGNFSLDFEVVYWVLNPDYTVYMNIHQRILLAIHEAFEKHELEFAFPTQTLYIEKNKEEA